MYTIASQVIESRPARSLGAAGVAAALLLAASTVAAVPVQLTQQGRLTSSAAEGTPLTGQVTLTFTFYDAAQGGTELWSEEITTDLGQDGFYSVELGSDANPIDSSVLAGREVWMGLSVDGDAELTPRVSVTSVPYAVVSGVAEQVADGAVGASALADGAVGADQLADVPASKISGLPTLLGDVPCNDGQVPFFSNNGWGCANLNTGNFTPVDQSCSMSGTTVVGIDASGGLVCSSAGGLVGNSFVASDQACTGAGEVVAGFDAAGNVVCTPVPSYDGTDFALSDQGCATGDVVTGIDANGNVTCVTKQDPKTILRQHMTAEWLDTNANFNPARGRSLTGSRLDILNGSQTYEKLFDVPLTTAGQLSTSSVYVLTLEMLEDPLTSDNDISIGISDGTNVVMVQRADAGNSTAGSVMEGADGNLLSNETTLNPMGNSGATHRWFQGRFRLGADTHVIGRVREEVSPGAATATRTIDRTAALKIVVFANNATEEYGIYSLDATLEREGN